MTPTDELEALRNRIAVLEKELEIEYAVNEAMTDVGVYVKAVIGPNGYDKRTEFMEGWNACAMEVLRSAVAAREATILVRSTKWPDASRPTPQC